MTCNSSSRHRRYWVVTARQATFSATGGWARSAYSSVRCPRCGRAWRTKAAYVASLPDEVKS